MWWRIVSIKSASVRIDAAKQAKINSKLGEKMKKSNWLGIIFSAVTIVFFLAWIPINAERGSAPVTVENTAANSVSLSAPVSDTALPQAVKLVAMVRDGVVFFSEDGTDSDTGNPFPPPSQPLAPITEEKTFEFETGRVVIPANSVKDFLQIDVYLRQRYTYRNDGQNNFRAVTNPIVEIESAALPQPLRFAVMENGLHLRAGKFLSVGEWGTDSRGNFGRAFITAKDLDAQFGPGTARYFFKNDITISMHVANTVHGLDSYVAGTFTQIYGN
jgi:hypothetical protein